MNHNEVHSSHGNISFIWENKPGVSKVMTCPKQDEDPFIVHKLPPPPCPAESIGNSGIHHIQIPLRPCTFQPPLRSSSRKHDQGPFLAAYKECTRSTRVMKKSDLRFSSCKSSCGVKEDCVVRISQIPNRKSGGEKCEELHKEGLLNNHEA